MIITVDKKTIDKISKNIRWEANKDAIKKLVSKFEIIDYSIKIIKNPVRNLVDDVDSLPMPDYDIKDHYILDSGKIRRFTRCMTLK